MNSMPTFVGAPLPRPGLRQSTRPAAAPRTPVMAAPLTSYAGGLDRLSSEPYGITRYLFKYRPATTDADEQGGVSDAMIGRIYRQILGNAYLMDEERAELAVAESQFKAGNISTKDFVRTVAKSAAYKTRFFDRFSQFRFIELNFKHLLGRAPTDQFEVSTHYQIFAEAGYEAEIDSYIDSAEYDQVFGYDTAPYMRFRGTYAPNSTFNMQCKLEGGWAGSDKNKNVPAWFTETSPAQVSAGLPAIPNAEHPSRYNELPAASLERYRNELEIALAKQAECQQVLDKAYDSLKSSRDFLNPYMNMAKDMDVTPVFGQSYGDGAVQVFSGQYTGASTGGWGVSGVEEVRGRSRRVAADIGRKEKRLESVKALVVDIEKKIAILEADAANPVFTPEVEVAPAAEAAAARMAEAEATARAVGGTAVKIPVEKTVTAPGAPEEVVEEEEVMVVEGAAPEVVRREVPVIVASTMADIKKKSVPLPEKEESEGGEGEGESNFLGGKGPKPSFPGDGSEMIIG